MGWLIYTLLAVTATTTADSVESVKTTAAPTAEAATRTVDQSATISVTYTGQMLDFVSLTDDS